MDQETDVQLELDRLEEVRSRLERSADWDYWIKQWERMLAKLTDVNAAISRETAKGTPFCKAGCCHCCNQIFSVSPAEIQVIGWYLLTHPETLSRFMDAYAKRQPPEGELAEIMEHYARGGAEADEASKEYFKKKRPCALLEQGVCTIYPVRPLTCASFISIIPPRICALEPKGVMTNALWRLYEEGGNWLQAQKIWPVEMERLADVSTLLFRYLTRLREEVLKDD